MTEANTFRNNLPTIIGASLGVTLGLGVSALALFSIIKAVKYFWGF